MGSFPDGRRLQSYKNPEIVILVKMYALRRIRDGFKENKTLADPGEIQNSIKRAEANLAAIKRQVPVIHVTVDRGVLIEIDNHPLRACVTAGPTRLPGGLGVRGKIKDQDMPEMCAIHLYLNDYSTFPGAMMGDKATACPYEDRIKICVVIGKLYSADKLVIEDEGERNLPFQHKPECSTTINTSRT
uniref:Complex 1 LYR protein domain-containing protein n=1 Tax=Timema douglasi TaxID=61478 RepID=A0A7R8VQA3_TIMDO|nr:unnamed protein product [Timema douglasi]